MIKGVGIDTVSIRKTQILIENFGAIYTDKVYTSQELKAAEHHLFPAEYLASRFAAKEAAFKAIAHLTKAKTFDLCCIETLNRDDGSPVITINDTVKQLLEEIGATKLFISITTEDDYATTVVIAAGE